MTPWNAPTVGHHDPFANFGVDLEGDRKIVRRWATTYVELYGNHPMLQLSIDMSRIRTIVTMGDDDLDREIRIAKVRARLRGTGRSALAAFYELARNEQR